ncbi:phosphoribosylanthranilate isomerase [Actinoplanes derwentensis]|uniref:N-(5'-phosphoribosyl)anthranilate isomerase n=1 Tax=Actinoplanes derwentensis TaxID=113562 RepID=A0A1H1RB72_9ACTN|nr:hypothetical protein [Actinoplanes derwentensis]GID88059.1 N-(5'-phosphoribosyl)anthranilate isomerase [Actinoplanes derwentensis]SDS32766.1 phosphoribosylanthranilate isomerase [Actinoplanes derwentensis]
MTGRRGALLKVCGATSATEVRLLAEAGADYVGLWFGVTGGPADLTVDELVTLAGEARAAGIHPVLVTFLGAVDALHEAITRSGIRHLQLHAYQAPGAVAALRRAHDGLSVLKVLHLRDGQCLEERFIGAYQRAGTTMFLLDKTTATGRVGSTGHRLDPAEVRALMPRLSVPFLLAGGVSADSGGYHDLIGGPSLHGVDVDTGARDPLGGFDSGRISSIARAWQPFPDPLR